MTQAELIALVNSILVDGKPITAADHRTADGHIISQIYEPVVNSTPYGPTTGTNNYSVTFSPSVSAFSNGKLYLIRVGNTATAAITVNSKKVYRTDGTQAVSGHFVAGIDYLLSYNSALDSGNGGFIVVNELQHGLVNDRGFYDASVNLYPVIGGSGPAASVRHGDLWTISVAGTLSAGVSVLPGDVILSHVENPGQTAANWTVLPGRNSVPLVSNTKKNIIPTGTIDGVNDTFVFPDANPIDLQLYADGDRMTGGGVDFTQTGDTVVFNVPPVSAVIGDYTI